MFEKQVIKTYSRAQPLSVFKSSTALVPAYPNPADKLNVRESRINDKTLDVDPFENTFDRILTEERVASRTSSKDSKNNSDNENDGDVFKKPVSNQRSQRNLRNKTKKKYNTNEEIEKSNKIAKGHNLRKNQGVKRKKIHNISSDEDTNSDSQESGDENSIKVVKKTKKKPKKEKKKEITSPVKNLPIIIVHSTDTTSLEEVNEHTPSVENNGMSILINDDKSLDRANSDSIDFGDDFCKSKEESISNVLRKKLLHSIPTSTPREHKSKMVVNMQNLSPIVLDKENKLNFEEGKRFTAVNMDKELLEQDLTEDCNLNNDVSSDSALELKSGLIKSSTKQITNVIGGLTDNNKESDDVNNSSISELLNNDKSNNKENSKSVSKYTVEESIVSDKVAEFTPVWADKNNEVTRSFVESPLMFDDTQDNENKLNKEHSTTMQRLKELSENLAQDSTEQIKISAQEQANDSSFYPHDWSDDYNSSYEYSGEQNNVSEGRELKKKNSVSKIHTDLDDLLNNKNQSDDNKINGINTTTIDTEENDSLSEDADKSKSLKENKSIDNNLNDNGVEKSSFSSKYEGSDEDLEKSLHLKLSSKSIESNDEFDDSSQVNQVHKSNQSQSPILSRSNSTNQDIADHNLEEFSQLDQFSKRSTNQTYFHSQENSPNEDNSNLELEEVSELGQSNKSIGSQLSILSLEILQSKISISDQESKEISKIDQSHLSARDQLPILSQNGSQNENTSNHQLEAVSQIDDLDRSSKEQSPTLTQNNSKRQNSSDYEMEEDSQLDLSNKSVKDQLQIASESNLRDNQIENDNQQDLTEQMDVAEEIDSNLDAEDHNSDDKIASVKQIKISEEVDNSLVEISEIPDQVDHTIQKSNAETLEKQSIENKCNYKEVIICLEKIDPQNIKSLLKSVRNANKIKVKSKTIGKKKNSSKKAKAHQKKKKNVNEKYIKSNYKSDDELSNHSTKVLSPNLSNNFLRKKENEQKLETVKNETSKLEKLELSSNTKRINSIEDSTNRIEQNSDLNDPMEHKNIIEKLKIKESHVVLTKLDLNAIAKLKKSRKSDTLTAKKDFVALERLKSTSKVNKKRSKLMIEELSDEENSNIEDNEEKNIVDNFEADKVNDSFNALRSKLNDPSTITMRRRTHRKLDRPALAAITEDQAVFDEDEDEVEEDHNEIHKDNGFMKSLNSRQSQPVFLKPGKSWARSLSIINHFYSGQNLDDFAVGRGQNWRHSVQSILKMQNDANRNSTAESDTERESQAHTFAAPKLSQRESHRQSTIVRSPNRFSKRFSMRIIPGSKRSTLTDDLMNSQRSSISDRTRKTSISRKTSLKISRDTLIETEDDLIKSAKDIILKRCNQISYLPFNESFPDSYIEHCRKIGEGVYGEVFLYDDGEEKSVIKIIPIEGSELVNCEPQKKFHEILSEIIIAEELHKLRFEDEYNTNGFVGVNRIMCVIGKYPEKLIDLWKEYDRQKKSENDCPSMFHDQQLYIILELAHGGQDLEAYQFQNASQSYAIFLQTAFALAVAEKSLEFEHRDLHWGNLLISKTDDTDVVYKLGQGEVILPTKGVKVSVIDFTLSRMSYKGCKIFNDLAADPTLFEAQGEYQFDIYRMMRDKVNNDWQQFDAYTNILWLDYTLDKMISGVRYKKKTTKIHKTAIEEMTELRQEILNYSSTYEFVNNCEKISNLIRSTDA